MLQVSIWIGENECDIKPTDETKVSDEESNTTQAKTEKLLLPNDFVEGGKFSLALFKKRIKEFSFIKKQPRFRKYFFIQKRMHLDKISTIANGKVIDKYITANKFYKSKKDLYMRELFEDNKIANGAKLLGCYWTCAKFIYHPETIEKLKKYYSGWFKINLFDGCSYEPLVFLPISLAENVKRKKIDKCYISGGEFVPKELAAKIADYCLGLTDEKPNLTGYVIRK